MARFDAVIACEEAPTSASPLPLAGEVDALDRARRVGEAASTKKLLWSGTRTPTLPRKRPASDPQAGEGAHHRCVGGFAPIRWLNDAGSYSAALALI